MIIDESDFNSLNPYYICLNYTIMNLDVFHREILEGIPTVIPTKQAYDSAINHAPKRKEILSLDEKKLALRKKCVKKTILFHKSCEKLSDFYVSGF